MPAKVAAIIMSVRAATSSAPWCTARGRTWAISDIAFSHQRSDTGLAPQ